MELYNQVSRPVRSPYSHKRDVRIVKLTPTDAQINSDHLLHFHELIVSSESMYPGIDKWLREKVIPGLKSSERACYVGYEGMKPVVSAVVKRGENAKFCHLKLGDDFQNIHLGEAFFALMVLEVRSMAKEIHFTLPEGLWENKRPFFESFGFGEAIASKTQYRLFERELRCSALYHHVWRSVLERLPNLMNLFSFGEQELDSRLLMSIKPEYAHKIIAGQKTIELRRRFSDKWIGDRVILYASKPAGQLVGEATISNVISGTPDELWENFGQMMGCSREEFDKYTDSRDKVFAIFLDDIRPFVEPIPISQLSRLVNEDLKPPQSYTALERNESWTRAISVAGLLHGTVGKSTVVHL